MAPMSKAAALETSKVVQGMGWPKGSKDWGRTRRIRVYFLGVLQGSFKMEWVDSKGLLVRVNLGRQINVDGIGRAARRGRVGALSSSSKGNLENNRAEVSASRCARANRKGGG